jgi:hypothetical protein
VCTAELKAVVTSAAVVSAAELAHKGKAIAVAAILKKRAHCEHYR